MNNTALAKMRQLFPDAPDWLLNNEGLRQDFTELAIKQNRWNGFVDADVKALREFGYESFSDYWCDLLIEPMKASTFISLLSYHLHDAFKQRDGRPGPIRAIERAFDLAQDMNEPWFFTGVRLKALMVRPRGAAEWLLAMPRQRHLVPATLASVLRGEEPLPLPVSAIQGARPATPRGRKPEKTQSVITAMRAALDAGVWSPEDLRNLKEKQLEERFDASRDTCRKAREQVLSEFVAKSNSDNLATNDK